MSRIGNKPIIVPTDVSLTLSESEVSVKGPKGELTSPISAGIVVKVAENQVQVSRKNDEGQTKAYHGLVRSLIENNIIGVSQGYQKTLKLVGTGYRVAAKGANLSLSVGFSHQVDFMAVEGVTLKVEGNDTIIISGIDKQKIGQVAANIRKIRPPEPYKGKGIRYDDEVVRRKAGKTAA